MTDAGTPSVSDPGGELVAAWAAEGGVVVPVPGRVGGPGRGRGVGGRRARAGRSRGSCRGPGANGRERLARIAADDRGTILYEAPTRVAATLRDLAEACGPDRPGAVCRELTKLHESIVRGSLGELAAAAGAGRDHPAARRVRDRGR